jgi:cell division protein ZapB
MPRRSHCRNILTLVCRANYSCGMISEFDLLSDKISKLAQLAQSLRQQNAGLRQQIETLNTEMRQQIDALNTEMRQQIDALNTEMHQRIDTLNADKAMLAERMSEAHDRVAAVLEQLPAPEPEVQQPEEPHDEDTHEPA